MAAVLHHHKASGLIYSRTLHCNLLSVSPLAGLLFSLSYGKVMLKVTEPILKMEICSINLYRLEINTDSTR